MTAPAEVPLPGGAVTTVVRAGDTVRRRPGERAGYVRRLLAHLEAAAWPGAPRHLGTDEHGREMLAYIEGHAAWEPEQPDAVTSDDSLAETARLVREFHDLTAGTPLAEGAEVVCHNDLAPRNTVYQDRHGAGLRPVAFIDWDIAAPGARVHDVAHVCWQFCRTGAAGRPARETGPRMRLVCDAYGLADADRARLVDTVLWWQDRCRRGIEASAAQGEPAMIRLRDSGVVAAIQGEYARTAEQRAALESWLIS